MIEDINFGYIETHAIERHPGAPTRTMPNHPYGINVAAALLLSGALLAASAQDNLPDRLRASAAWAAGERQSYQVQQVVKERAAGREENRFLSNGTLEITAVESTADTLTFIWHRRMDNAELELVREPWGIRGSAPYARLLASTVRDGLPLTVRLDLRTQRVRIENRDDVVTALSQRLQSVGGESFGNLTSRSRVPTPDERNTREPSKAALGIHQPLVKRDATKYANTPRNGKAVAAWYARLAAREIEDFLGFYGREFQLDNGDPPGSGPIRVYRPTGPGEVLVTMASAPVQPETATAPGDEDERDGEPKSVGLAGGTLRPVTYEAKIEVTLPSGWPKRAAILRTEADGTDGASKRTVLRRVYLRR